MSKREDIFRKAALERLTSPEQLDELMQVTDRRAWIALLALGLLLGLLLLWSWLGRVHDKVSGEGILIRGDHIYRVFSSERGQIAQINVSSGSVVTQGQVIATLLQPRLADQLKLATAQVTELKQQLDKIRAAGQTQTLSRDELVVATQLRLSEMEQRQTALQSEWEQATKIISSFDGRVLELLVKPGDLLKEGEPVLSLEEQGKDLQAVIFVDANEGGKLRSGMDVQLVPASHHKLEHGYLKGKVRFKGDFPVTRQAAMKVLENEHLVEKLLAKAPPITVYVDLLPSPTGYQWSSTGDNAGEIRSGTFCSANIVVSEQRPIAWVLPVLQR